MDKNDEITPIEDSFLDEHLFAVSTKPLWYADIANYLATGKVPPSFVIQGTTENYSSQCLIFSDGRVPF